SSTLLLSLYFFLFCILQHPATPELSTLSLHDALPIWAEGPFLTNGLCSMPRRRRMSAVSCSNSSSRSWCIVSSSALTLSSTEPGDRKSTRLNSSHVKISYAVFCLKKKKNTNKVTVHLI